MAGKDGKISTQPGEVSRASMAKGKMRFVDIEDHKHMPEIFAATGRYRTNANGIVPLTYSEIVMFTQGIVDLSDWEIETLRSMSDGFCSGLRTGEKTLGVFPGDKPIVDGDDDD